MVNKRSFPGPIAILMAVIVVAAPLHGFYLPVGNPALFGTNKQQINDFLLKIHLLKRTKLAEIYYLEQLRIKATNLITLIKKEYHLK